MFIPINEEVDAKLLEFLEESRDEFHRTLCNLEWEKGKDYKKDVVAVYSNQLVSKLLSLIILLENKQYDTIFILTRAFFENYAILFNLLDVYGTEDFDKYFVKLLHSDMSQGIKILGAIPGGCRGYFECWREYIENYLDSKCDVNNLEQSIQNYIKKYSKKNCLNITDEVQEALKKCKRLQKEGAEVEDAAFVYRYLCCFAHSNISAIDERCSDGQHIRGANCNCANLEPALGYVGFCFLEIMDKMKSKLL